MAYERFKELGNTPLLKIELQNQKLAWILNNLHYAYMPETKIETVNLNLGDTRWTPEDIDIIEGLRADGQLAARLTADDVTARLDKDDIDPNVLNIAIRFRDNLINNDSDISKLLKKAHAPAKQLNSNSYWSKPAAKVAAGLVGLGGAGITLLLLIQFAHVVPPFALTLYALAMLATIVGLTVLAISGSQHLSQNVKL